LKCSSDGEPEGAIYCYGAIRFLAMSGNYLISQPSAASLKVSKHKHLPYRLIKHGIIQLMILHIQIFNEYGSVNEIEGQSLHALYQLLASMRVLLGLPILSYFVKTRNSTFKTIPHEDNDIHLELAGKHLVKIAFICLQDLYVQANVIRTLSVLSDIEVCCDALSKDVVKLGQIVGTFKLEESIDMRSKQKSLGLISRLGYTIGNVMEKNDQARVEFFRNDVVMRYCLELIHFFSNQSYIIQNTNGDSVADVLIKYVRVIANISVNSEVGYLLNLKANLGNALLNILKNVEENTVKEYKELLIATLAALHNLTYYQTLNEMKQSYQHGSVVDKIQDICETLCYKFLTKESSLEKIEVIRVLGNMTRDNSVRETFLSSNGLINIVRCLNEDDKNLLENSCGVLVNILNDFNSRNSFKNLSGMVLLRDSLRKNIYENNWLLCETICKAFWNFLIDRNDFVHDFDTSEIDTLSNDLAEYLGKLSC
jgi:armadillo repeat-containing protein 2